MANASAKKVHAQNIASLRLLRNGFFVSQIIHLLAFWLFRSNFRTRRIVAYGLSTVVSGLLGLSLHNMGQAKMDANGGLISAGSDLGQSGASCLTTARGYELIHNCTGLTAYM